jgi:uncharacterized lipoprotein YmbA
MNTYFLKGLTMCGATVLLAACSSHYYKVTDPASNKAYYTKKIDGAGRAGAVKIKDEKTGSTVTLQSSEVKEISANQYEAELKAPVTQPPAIK